MGNFLCNNIRDKIPTIYLIWYNRNLLTGLLFIQSYTNLDSLNVCKQSLAVLQF